MPSVLAVAVAFCESECIGITRSVNLLFFSVYRVSKGPMSVGGRVGNQNDLSTDLNWPLEPD